MFCCSSDIVSDSRGGSMFKPKGRAHLSNESSSLVTSIVVHALACIHPCRRGGVEEQYSHRLVRSSALACIRTYFSFK